MTEELDTILHKALGYLDQACFVTFSDDEETELHTLITQAADLTFRAIGKAN